MGMEQSYQAFQGFFDQYGFAAILAIGILPIPFQVAMITAGLSGYPIALFALAALIARGLRYYGEDQPSAGQCGASASPGDAGTGGADRVENTIAANVGGY